MPFDFQSCVHRLYPTQLLSRLARWPANCRWVWFKNWAIRRFITKYKIDLVVPLESDPASYSHFNQFFIRLLKPEARPIAKAPDAIVSPVDGCLSQKGAIEAGQLIQAKGFGYALQDLLGGESKWTALFQNGQFACFYLAPGDYHRVHMPFEGRLCQIIHVPGRLYSVRTALTARIPRLFTRNERIVTVFETSAGPMAVVLVGALLVGSIHTVWSDTTTFLHRRRIRSWCYAPSKSRLARGAELGHFRVGSTVIVLFGPGRIHWAEGLVDGTRVQFGQAIGRVCATVPTENSET